MGQVIDLPKRRPKAPIAENGKVALPRRRPNKELRTREYLTPAEAERLIAENPVRLLAPSARPKAQKKRPSYFTNDELARLWPELAKHFPPGMANPNELPNHLIVLDAYGRP